MLFPHSGCEVYGLWFCVCFVCVLSFTFVFIISFISSVFIVFANIFICLYFYFVVSPSLCLYGCSIYFILFSHEISHNGRISPTKELGSSLWRGGSASPARGPNVRSQPLSSITSTLGSARGQGLKFLQSSRDTLNQPVPTASYRSYR